MLGKQIFLSVILCIGLCTQLPFAMAEEDTEVHGQLPLASEVTAAWGDLKDAIAASDYRVFAKSVEDIVRLRDEAGYESLEEYSGYLLQQSEEQSQKGQADQASSLRAAALRLSPNSAYVLLKALPQVSIVNLPGALLKICGGLFGDPFLVFYFLDNFSYPVLWALTIAVYLSFIAFFASRSHEWIAIVARGLPSFARGIFGPPLALALIVVPMSLPPLWCLFIWSLYCFVIPLNRSWPAFLAGATIALWAAIVPLKETANYWLKDEGFIAVLRVLALGHGDTDEPAIGTFLQQRPNYAPAWYALGEVARRNARFDVASRAFDRARGLLPGDSAAIASKAMVQYLAGDSEGAKTLVEEAEAKGLSSATFFHNASLVYFDLGDTVNSKKYVERGRKEDRATMEKYSKREDKFGAKSPGAVGSVRLSFMSVISSMKYATAPTDKAENARVDALMKASFMEPPIMALLGSVLIVMFLLRGAGRARTKFAYYLNYEHPQYLQSIIRVLPGGAWVLQGRFAPSVAASAMILLLALPLVGWPEGFNMTKVLSETWYGIYFGMVCLFTLLVVGAGFTLKQKNSSGRS